MSLPTRGMGGPASLLASFGFGAGIPGTIIVVPTDDIEVVERALDAIEVRSPATETAVVVLRDTCVLVATLPPQDAITAHDAVADAIEAEFGDDGFTITEYDPDAITVREMMEAITAAIEAEDEFTIAYTENAVEVLEGADAMTVGPITTA